VAQIGCAAVQKTVRRRGQRLVAVSCHYDIIDWLEPDWVYQPHLGKMEVNTATERGRLWRRPPVELEVRRVHRKAWELFRQYHYLSHTFNKAARCFVAFYQGEPVALQAVLPLAHAMSKRQKVYRGHRAVCLPDYQGIGIGNALSDYIASAYRGIGCRFYSTTTHPSLVRSRIRSPHWRCRRPPSLGKPRTGEVPEKFQKWVPALMRLTSTWEYVGPALDRELAQALITGASSGV
jgi:GNAT superfamily N-acetyltransferase